MNIVNENRKELSNCMVKIFYQKKDDSYSYLEETHEKYKELKEDEKLNYSKNIEHDFTEDEESDRDTCILNYPYPLKFKIFVYYMFSLLYK